MDNKPKGKAFLAMVAVSIVLIFSIAALNTPSGGKGSPEGEHGRKKDSAEQGLLLGLIFGDQWVVVRDLTPEGNGQPIYFSWEWPEEAYTADGDFDPPAGVYPTGYSANLATGCVQPVSFEPVSPLDLQFELGDGLSNVFYYDSYGRERVPTYLIPLDPECKIPDVYAESWGLQVMEADSGRFNMARSPQNVIDAAYEETLNTMNQALAFSLDPAGRLVLELETTDDFGELQTYLKTIDSPLENLALYQRLMLNGCLAGTDHSALTEGSVALLQSNGMGYLVCGYDTTPEGSDFLRAASFMAGAGDKTGRINVDLLIYLNNRLEVNEVVWSANKQEVSIGYYNFQGASYNRNTTHAAVKADLLQPPPGHTDLSIYPNYFNVAKEINFYDKVFSAEWPGNGGNGVVMNTPIINFVRAADDALAIINYLHNYALPTYPLLPVPEPTYPAE